MFARHPQLGFYYYFRNEETEAPRVLTKDIQEFSTMVPNLELEPLPFWL